MEPNLNIDGKYLPLNSPCPPCQWVMDSIIPFSFVTFVLIKANPRRIRPRGLRQRCLSFFGCDSPSSRGPALRSFIGIFRPTGSWEASAPFHLPFEGGLCFLRVWHCTPSAATLGGRGHAMTKRKEDIQALIQDIM